MRKIGFISLLIIVACLFALTFTVAAAGPKSPVVPVAAAAVPAAAAAAVPEKHPNIQDALGAMRTARHHLEIAPAEFHGHRAKAIAHLDQAIAEAEMCEKE